MQLFRCPFCGERDETEFHYEGEAGNLRPDGERVAAGAWADYLYLRDNGKGVAEEVWLHTTCGELFVMHRDTVSHRVIGCRTIAEAETRR